MSQGSPYRITATESAMADVVMTERKYEHPEVYNRNIGTTRAWTHAEQCQIRANIEAVAGLDPEAAQELLEILGFQ